MSAIARFFAAVLAVLWAVSVLVPVLAAEPAKDAAKERDDEPHAGKVPRFVALGSDRINARVGPSVKYPIEWVFVRKGLPVEVVAEFEYWRRIRDIEGAEGWVHKSLLTGRRTALIRGPQTRELKREPDERQPAVAQAEPGVIGRLHKCRDSWCQMSVGDRKGWIRRNQIWGVYPDEQFD